MSYKVAVTSRSFSRNPTLRKILLSKYDQVTFNDKSLNLSGASLIEFLRGHDKAITALESIDNDILSSLPQLKVISKYGVGCDMIDMNALRRHNVRFGWTGGVNRRSVSELVIAFAINLLRHVPSANREVRSGVWRQHVGGYLSGKNVGIIGCGFIGQDLAKILRAFDCNILINDVVNKEAFCQSVGAQSMGLDDLLSESDVVSLHVPFDESTRNLLSADRLTSLKPGAILINTARGGIVDEEALKECLKTKAIAGAAFDVFQIEPPNDSDLLNLDNFIVTPHIGGSALEAILAMGEAAVQGLDINELP